MDDSLEVPTSFPEKSKETTEVDDEQSSDEEGGGLDWGKLLSGGARPVIPKRGEKEFEPAPGGGSGLQLHILDRARNAMFTTLRTSRVTSSKAISYAVWYPSLGRAHVTLARGTHFASMGHSAPREVRDEQGVVKQQKRLELLPEEAIYLVERGSVYCWKECDLPLADEGLGHIPGPPMTVQQVYSEMIGREGLTLEKFQVFAYLRRLGYVVTRYDPPNRYYPIPPPLEVATGPSLPLRFINTLLSWPARILSIFIRRFDWWRPVQFSRALHHDKNYASLFSSLRFMRAGHSVSLHRPKTHNDQPSPYHIFYNVYKPSTPFKKSAPQQPDFQIVVVNARTTPMPTLYELTDLFDVLPLQPVPLPRQRKSPNSQSGANTTTTITTPPNPTNNTRSNSLLRRLFSWAFETPASLVPDRKPNPFMALKAGRKTVVIAVVDSGSISFFRFGQGEFTEWPMA